MKTNAAWGVLLGKSAGSPGKPVTVRQHMVRGAVRGALLFGILGFIAGLTICIVNHLPVPPLFVTELSAMLGAALGGVVGWACTVRLWRLTLLGAAWGSLLGLPLSFAAGGTVTAMFLACAMVGTFLGYQSGSLPEGQMQNWRLRASKK